MSTFDAVIGQIKGKLSYTDYLLLFDTGGLYFVIPNSGIQAAV